MKIGILTSSRADFGIYYPLVRKLWDDKSFQVEIIAFGTHLQNDFGYTVNEIERLGFNVKHKIVTPIKNDTPKDISNNIGISTQLFADLWPNNKLDLVLLLGIGTRCLLPLLQQVLLILIWHIYMLARLLVAQ